MKSGEVCGSGPGCARSREGVALPPNTAMRHAGAEAIESTLAARTADIAARAARLGLGSAPAALRAGHFLGLRFPGGGLHPGLLASLAAQQVHVSVRGASMRVTPHLYNTDEDVDRLFAALERVLT